MVMHLASHIIHVADIVGHSWNILGPEPPTRLETDSSSLALSLTASTHDYRLGLGLYPVLSLIYFIFWTKNIGMHSILKSFKNIFDLLDGLMQRPLFFLFGSQPSSFIWKWLNLELDYDVTIYLQTVVFHYYHIVDNTYYDYYY